MENTPAKTALLYQIRWGKKDTKKPRKECEECGRVIAHYKSGKPYNHNCKKS